MTYTIAAFYKFVRVANPEALREEFCAAFYESEMCGTMLLASEGVNGTVAGSGAVIQRFLRKLAEKVGLDESEVKFSQAEEQPFGRLKFKVKDEILAFRRAVVDPTQAGQYVAADEWNDLIAQPDVLVLDTRNGYETEMGTFAGSVDPGIETFSEFATYVKEKLDPAKHRRVAMFCTGGIRCEKASAFMLQEGFAEVYHLRGGILRYLEDIPKEESKWLGECFVFDRRRSVGFEDLKDVVKRSSRVICICEDGGQ